MIDALHRVKGVTGVFFCMYTRFTVFSIHLMIALELTGLWYDNGLLGWIVVVNELEDDQD